MTNLLRTICCKQVLMVAFIIMALSGCAEQELPIVSEDPPPTVEWIREGYIEAPPVAHVTINGVEVPYSLTHGGWNDNAATYAKRTPFYEDMGNPAFANPLNVKAGDTVTITFDSDFPNDFNLDAAPLDEHGIGIGDDSISSGFERIDIYLDYKLAVTGNTLSFELNTEAWPDYYAGEHSLFGVRVICGWKAKPDDVGLKYQAIYAFLVSMEF